MYVTSRLSRCSQNTQHTTQYYLLQHQHTLRSHYTADLTIYASLSDKVDNLTSHYSAQPSVHATPRESTTNSVECTGVIPS